MYWPISWDTTILKLSTPFIHYGEKLYIPAYPKQILFPGIIMHNPSAPKGHFIFIIIRPMIKVVTIIIS